MAVSTGTNITGWFNISEEVVKEVLFGDEANRKEFRDEAEHAATKWILENLRYGKKYKFAPLSPKTIQNRKSARKKDEERARYGYIKPLMDTGSLYQTIRQCLTNKEPSHRRTRFGDETSIHLVVDSEGNMVWDVEDSGYTIPLTEYQITGWNTIPQRDFLGWIFNYAWYRKRVAKIGANIAAVEIAKNL